MCRGFFPTAMYFGREQNCEEYEPQNGQYLHCWGLGRYNLGLKLFAIFERNVSIMMDSLEDICKCFNQN